MTKSFIFTTSCDANYLDQALVLSQSVKKQYRKHQFILGLNEKSDSLATELTKKFPTIDKVVYGEKLHEKFDELNDKYGIVQLSCAVKPRLISNILKKYKKPVIFLDPDTYLYGRLTKVEKALEVSDFVMTPHIYKPGNVDMEMSSQFHGIFNLGFLAVRPSKKSLEILEWWNDRLENYCAPNAELGIFTDQSWASLIVGMADTYVIRDPGYNFGTWNLSEHYLSSNNNQKYLVDGSRLVFAHFSGFRFQGISSFISKNKIPNLTTVQELVHVYSVKIADANSELHPFQAFRKPKEPYKSERLLIKWKVLRKKQRRMLLDTLKKYAPLLLSTLILIKRKIRSLVRYG